jgi:hypothetical protein
MSQTDILSLIDAELSRLEQVRALLAGTIIKRPPGRPKSTTKPKRKKRNLTPEGRARIAAAVKARWAAQKKAAK